VLSFAAVLVFGFISFYFIDVRHFGNDFTWQQSLLHTFRIFLLVDDPSLHPVTRFGNEFIVLIRSLGFLTWGFLVFTLIKPHLRKYTGSENYREKARFLLSQFGNSASDYFKVYKDKLYFFSDRHEAFIAYRIAKNFAIVLEEPVCAAENKIDVIREFDMHCRKMGLKTVFYRVGENSIPWFDIVRKQKLMIGQEAILEIKKFSLEGRDKKSLRNGLNNLKKNGYDTVVYKAPHSDELMSALKKVSDEWLESFQKEEIIFSQGMFDTKEIKQHDVIALASSEGKIVAFLDIIPDYTEDETTYDLIRKTNDAPGAAMDALIIKLIEYSNLQGKLFINMGLVPMSGLNESDNTAEQIIRLAANKIKRFQHYKGLRSFKEKYATIWENKYLVYEKDFDLIQIPGALNSVMKP
jgi:phosphatidylglycerol lysyltransferase